MKINSEHLYKYINELATDKKVNFNVYYDDQYVTQIYWNGDNFEWDTGTFTSEAFFNPLYDFIPIEEDKKIEKKNRLEILDWEAFKIMTAGDKYELYKYIITIMNIFIDCINNSFEDND